MRNRFDQLGKRIGLEALAPSGRTVAHDEIAADACYADLRHEPAPARRAERAQIGLLGRLAAVVCLFEIFSRAPGEDQALSCLGKLIALRRRYRRSALRRGQRLGGAFVRPFVWIISSGRPAKVLAALAARRRRGWPAGVYFTPGVLTDAKSRSRLRGLRGVGGLLRTGIVVASELPRDRSTLLVRLMAGGRTTAQAVEDLRDLPEGSYEHTIALPTLVSFASVLEGRSRRTKIEQEIIVRTQETYQKWFEKHVKQSLEQGLEQGRMQGLEQGRVQGLEQGRVQGLEQGRVQGLEQGREEASAQYRAHLRAILRRTLAARSLAPSREDEARIDACEDIPKLDRWLTRALTARTVAGVFR